MPERRHVDADLVRAARLQPAFDFRDEAAREFPLHRVMRDRDAARRHVVPVLVEPRLQRRHLRAVVARARDVRVDRAALLRGRAPGERRIGPRQLAVAAMRGELRRKPLMRAVRLRDDHQSARLLVQPVDDARPPLAADARQRRPAMRDKRVHQRHVRVAGRGMDDEPRRLHHDDQLRVLVDDIERDRLARGARRRGRRHRHFDALAGLHAVGGVRRRARPRLAHQRHAAFLDQLLHARARQHLARVLAGRGAFSLAGERLREILVEPRAAIVPGDGERMGLFFGSIGSNRHHGQ